MVLDLQEIRTHLETKRSELQEEIAHIQTVYPFSSTSPPSFEEIEERGEAARDMVKMEDALSLLRTQQRLLEQVERALQRLDEGSYGLCSVCGRPIVEERLRALPWVTCDIACEGERMLAKTDAQINQDVFDELTWDPTLSIAELDLNTIDGRILLQGTVETAWAKHEATRAAYRVRGVRAVENLLVVNPMSSSIHRDVDIAEAIKEALLLDSRIPQHRITIEVEHGHVTLSGNVAWAHERQAAVEAVCKIAGVTAIDNQIAVMPLLHASAAEIQRNIARAFARNAELPDDQIVVEVEGNHVTLRGSVEFWSERHLAEEIAWKSPGVTAVTNALEVLAG
jgi:osmotically-inducible protein OsmY